MESIGFVLIACSALFIYLDTTKHKIGKIPGEKGFLNMSPGQWVLGTLGLWVVAFPLYLINRSKLIEKAKISPQCVSPKKRKFTLFVLGLILLLSVLMSYYLVNVEKLSVESTAIDVVNQILHEQLFANPKVECVAVRLGEEFADNHYHAFATLNNGNDLKITIQVEGEDIYVSIPNQK